MGARHLERLFSDLDAGFAAAVAAEEDIAANDLAFSLSQDLSVTDDLLRDGGSLVIEDSVVPVDRVGHDFLVGGSWFVPVDRATVRLHGGVPAVPVHDVFLSALRRLARSAQAVCIGGPDGAHAGELIRASSHVVVRGAVTVAIPLALVDYVRLVRADSADVL